MSKMKTTLGILGAGILAIGSSVVGAAAHHQLTKDKKVPPKTRFLRAELAIDNLGIGIAPTKRDEDDMKWVVDLYKRSFELQTLVYLNELDSYDLDENKVKDLAEKCKDYFISKKGDSI